MTAIGIRLTWISTSVEIVTAPGMVIVAVAEILPAMPCGRIRNWPVPPVTVRPAPASPSVSDTSVNAILTTFVPLVVVICSNEKRPESDWPKALKLTGVRSPAVTFR